MLKAAGWLILGVGLGTGLGFLIWGRAASGPARAETPAIDLSVMDGGVYRVRHVSNGDSIVLESGIRVRYDGVNAPELKRSFVEDKAPLAAEATARNIDLVEGKRVRLRLAADRLDPYGRVVARVLVVPDESGGTSGEVDVGDTLVKEGLARAVEWGVRPDDAQRLKDLERQAKAAKLGLWGLEEKEGAAPTEVKPYVASSTSQIYHLATCPEA